VNGYEIAPQKEQAIVDASIAASSHLELDPA
jgi:hypothetical protein